MAVQAENAWILIDGRAGLLNFEAIAAPDYPLAQMYRNEGYTVLTVDASRASLTMTPRLVSCVGMVKAVLSIRAPFVQTPYQLYRYINKRLRNGILCTEQAADSDAPAAPTDARGPGDRRAGTARA